MSDDLNVRITGDPAGGVSAIEAFVSAIDRMASQVTSKLEEVNKSIQGTGEQIKHLHEPVDNLKEGVEAFGKRFEEAFSAKAILSEFATNLLSIVGPMALLETGLEGIKEILGEIKDFTREGIIQADEVRDLSISLGILNNDLSSGAERFERFRHEAELTRDLGHDLAKIYRDLQPLERERGFSESLQERIPELLSQIATLRGLSLDTAEAGFKRFMIAGAAGGASRNQFLTQGLGLTKDQIGQLDWRTLFAKMDEVASHWHDVGQSVESESRHIKDTLLEEFAAGFNGARGEATAGMAGIKAALSDPDVLLTIHTLGAGTAEAVHTVGDVASGLARLVNVIGGLDLDRAHAIITILADLDPTGTMYSLKTLADVGAEDRSTKAHAAAAAQRDAQVKAGYDIYAQIDPGARMQWQSLSAEAFLMGDVAKRADPERLKAFIADIKQSAADLIVTYGEVKKAHDKAFLPQNDAPPGGPNEDKLAGMREKIAKLTDAWNDQSKVIEIHIAALGLLDPRERAIASYYELNAENIRRETAATHDLDEGRRKLHGTSQQLLDAEKALANLKATDRDAELQTLLIGYSQAFTGAMMQAMAPGGNLDVTPENFGAWHDFEREMSEALTDALTKVDNFSAKAEEKLAEWVPRAAASVRAGMSQIKADVAEAINWIKMTQISLTMSTGVQPDDPQMAALTKKLLGNVDTQAGIDESRVVKIGERLNADAEKSAAKIVAQFDIAFHGFESLFSNIFQNGGRDFGQVAAQIFASSMNDLFSRSLESFIERHAGITQDANGLYHFAGGTQGFKTPQEAAQHSPFGQNLAIGTAAFSDLFNGYQAGASGQPNAIASSVLQGAVEGAMLGAAKGASAGVWGAVIGAAIGFVGAYLGKSETNPNVGGIPRVDASGHGTVLATPKAFDQMQIDTWSREITSTFDTMRDSITRAFIAGGAKPPGISLFTNMSPLTTPDKNLAATDIDQWIKGGMGADMMQKVGGDFSKIAQNLGMSSKRFGEIWDVISRIDPEKGAQDLTSLFTSIGDIRDFRDFMSGDRSMAALTGTKGSMTWQTQSGKLATATPYDDLLEFANQMIDVASHIKDFSPEGQIQQVAQLADMTKQYRQTEIQMVKELSQAIVNAHQTAEQMLFGIGVQRFTRDDGSVDEHGLAVFYQKRANDDLLRMHNAKSSAELQQWYQDYLQAVGNTGNAMIAENPANRQKALDWETESTNIGVAAFDQRANELGIAINKINDTVESQLDPAFQALLGSTTDLNTGVGNAGTGFRDLIPPLRDVGNKLLDLGPTIGSVNTALGNLAAAANAAAAAASANNGGAAGALNEAASNLIDATDYFVSTVTSAGFVGRTQAARTSR